MDDPSSYIAHLPVNSRRSFLQAGALGLGGLTLSDWLKLKASGAVRASAARQRAPYVLQTLAEFAIIGLRATYWISE